MLVMSSMLSTTMSGSKILPFFVAFSSGLGFRVEKIPFASALSIGGGCFCLGCCSGWLVLGFGCGPSRPPLTGGGDGGGLDLNWSSGFVAAAGAAAAGAAAARAAAAAAAVARAAACGPAAAAAAPAAAAHQGRVTNARRVMGCLGNKSTRVSSVVGDNFKCGGRRGRYYVQQPCRRRCRR